MIYVVDRIRHFYFNILIMKIKAVLKTIYSWLSKVIGIRLYLWLSKIMKTRPYLYEERNLLKNAASFKKVKSSLVMRQKWIPYPDYTDRIGWNQLLGHYKEEYIRRGETYLNYEWKIIKATDYLEYERSGDQTVMEIPFGKNNKALSDLFMAEMAEGEGRFIDQIINGVFYCCEMTSWSFSAHLWMQKEGGYLPNYQERLIEMGCGNLASLLAYIYYYLKPSFDKVNLLIAKRLRHELQVRILDPYMNEQYHWMAFNLFPGNSVNNWNPWNNFHVLQCFFLLENKRDRLAKAVYKTMTSVDHYINYIYDDGACKEGTFYWGYAAGKLYDYLQILYDGTSGAISIFDQPIIRNMGEYIVNSYVGNGWVVNFADATAKERVDEDLIFRYGKAVKSSIMTRFAVHIKQLSTLDTAPSGDIFRLFQTLLYQKELEKVDGLYETSVYSWYPKTEFCYMSNKNGFFVAAKGGYNKESHNHNDVGTFSLYQNTTPIFLDVGVGTYTRKTFSPERYSIWTMQSDYHNLPAINGISQCFGANYKATEVKFEPKYMFFSANIATAYPSKANVKKWIRSYRLKKDSLEIEDSFLLSKASEPNRIYFLTWGNVDISVPGAITIVVKEEKVLLSYANELLVPSVETISINDPRLFNVWGKQIHRISLCAREQTLSGVYFYKVTPMK